MSRPDGRGRHPHSLQNLRRGHAETLLRGRWDYGVWPLITRGEWPRSAASDLVQAENRDRAAWLISRMGGQEQMTPLLADKVGRYLRARGAYRLIEEHYALKGVRVSAQGSLPAAVEKTWGRFAEMVDRLEVELAAHFVENQKTVPATALEYLDQLEGDTPDAA